MGATTTSSVINLVKTLVGSGLMAMPLVLKADGIPLGLLTITWAALACGFGFYLQVLTSRYVPAGAASFFSICLLPYPRLAPFFDLLIAFNCFGSGLSYLVLFADLMPAVTGVGTRPSWVVANMVVVVPLCYMRRLDSLRYTSFLALAAVAYMVGLIVGNYAEGVDPILTGPIAWGPLGWSGFVGTFSIPVFGFAGHQNMYTVINEAADKTPRVLFRVVSVSVGGALALYAGVGALGYLTFGERVQGNLMVMYPPSMAVTVGQGAIALMVLLSYPLMFYPTRASIGNVYKHFIPASLDPSRVVTERTPLRVPTPELSLLQHVTITTFLLVLAYLFAFTVTSFGLVVAFIGATGCTSVAMIVPGVFGYGLLGRGLPPVSGDAHPRWLGYASLGLAIHGVVVMLTCLYAIFALHAF